MIGNPEIKPIFTIGLPGEDMDRSPDHSPSSLPEKSILKTSLKSVMSDSGSRNGSLINGRFRAPVRRHLSKQVSINESLFDAKDLELPGTRLKR